MSLQDSYGGVSKRATPSSFSSSSSSLSRLEDDMRRAMSLLNSQRRKRKRAGARFSLTRTDFAQRLGIEGGR